jgi:hypothetical protein
MINSSKLIKFSTEKSLFFSKVVKCCLKKLIQQKVWTAKVRKEKKLFEAKKKKKKLQKCQEFITWWIKWFIE